MELLQQGAGGAVHVLSSVRNSHNPPWDKQSQCCACDRLTRQKKQDLGTQHGLCAAEV